MPVITDHYADTDLASMLATGDPNPSVTMVCFRQGFFHLAQSVSREPPEIQHSGQFQ